MIGVAQPGISICECRSTFGPDESVGVPYNAEFYRTTAHRSDQYWSASLADFFSAAEHKGLVVVGSNIAGSNVFPVERDLPTELNPLTPLVGWVDDRSRGRQANVLGARADRVAAAEALDLMDLVTAATIKFGDCLRASR